MTSRAEPDFALTGAAGYVARRHLRPIRDTGKRPADESIDAGLVELVRIADGLVSEVKV